MSLYEHLMTQPGGEKLLAAARLRYGVLAALQHAGLDSRKPGRIRIDRLAEMLHDAGYELEVRLVPAGDLRSEAVGEVSR